MLTHYFQHSLGQESLLQKSLCTSLPSHLLPPYWGTGSEQSLVRCLAPPPQDTVQVLQLVQVAHLPSTGLKKNICALLLLKNDQVNLWALIGWVMFLLTMILIEILPRSEIDVILLRVQTLYFSYLDSVFHGKLASVFLLHHSRIHQTMVVGYCTVLFLFGYPSHNLRCMCPKAAKYPMLHELQTSQETEFQVTEPCLLKKQNYTNK